MFLGDWLVFFWNSLFSFVLESKGCTETYVVVCRVTVAGYLLAWHVMRDGICERGPLGQMYDRHAVGLLLVFIDHHDGGEVPVPGELADLPHRVLVAVAVS